MKKIIDGNIACSRIAYVFSEVCSIYPITPSSTMATNVDNLVYTKLNNIFGSKPSLIEMQSEAGAAGAMHGALLTGSLSSTFTASQGLLLMIPNMYKMAGEMLPGVVHVAARSLATQSLSIFGDHQDIYSARQTGFCMLASTNVFDAQNLAAVAHLSAIDGSLPFMHFFDGFRTSHELNTVEEMDVEKLKKLVNFEKINEYKNRTLHLNSNKEFGLAENEDIYFQHMESRNKEYNEMPDIVNKNMIKINELMGTNYKPFNYYGSPTATNVIISMGSVCDTVKELLEVLNDDSLGLIEVHLYRPFSEKYLLNVLPQTIKNIAVLDRTKEPGSSGEPLYLDVLSILKDKNINIVGGRYGLSSKNTTPSDIYDVYHMLKTELKNNFTISIEDDVTNLSLVKKDFVIEENTFNVKIYGFGSDGMVSASKDMLKLLHTKENLYVQGYFEYDSKKSGGVTVSNLRFSKEKINKPYYIESSDIVVVTKFEYLNKYKILTSLKQNGILLLNTEKSEEEINKYLSQEVKKELLAKNVDVYYVDAEKIALDNKIKGKISKIVEYLIFNLMKKDLKEEMVSSIENSFKNKGREIIESNIASLNDSLNNLHKLENLSYEDIIKISEEKNIYDKINSREGYDLKVSDLRTIKDGSYPCGLTKCEKRKISAYAPIWKKENCIQCGMCSIVCPHAVIRTFVDDKNDGIEVFGQPGKNFTVKISEEDCTGCGLCVNVCPGKGENALELQRCTYKNDVKEYFENYENPKLGNKFTIKGSQLEKPLFEFSGACAGCGETPYVKLLTQLFGKNMVIANATGCSSIYGGSAPSTPYLLPWANSLFEDNAEFALGMHLSFKQKRARLQKIISENINEVSGEIKEKLNHLLENFENEEITNELKEYFEKNKVDFLNNYIEDIPARTVWALGGDGWAYDIGYGGLDHVIHTNENVKILILDTEVYSNTGGQASKSTKMGAVAEFANMGKTTYKKDLFNIVAQSPNCYVASVALGANMMQTIKAFKEAKEHNGPAIIIAYAPCISHGIKSGMSNMIDEQKKAVESGYTLLMRYNPVTKEYFMDSAKPNFDKYDEFLQNENRYKSLSIKDQELAMELNTKQKENAILRYNTYLEKTKK